MAQDKPQKAAPQNAGPDKNLESILAEWKASALEEPQEKTPPISEPTPVEASTEKENTGVVAEVPIYPRDLFIEAEIENEQREFTQRLLDARRPSTKTEYKPPPVPPAVVEQTRLEMAEGARRVAEFEKMKAEQKAISRAPEPWEGKTVEVFRPPDFDEYRKSFGLPAPTVSKDQRK